MAKLEYLFRIIYLLQTGNILTAKVIGDRLGISARNARAYVSTLMNAGVPIMSLNGRRGGYYLDEGYFLKAPALTEDEIIGMQIVREMMDNQSASQSSIEMISAVSKVLLAEKVRKAHVERRQFPDMANGTANQILTLVQLAITEKRKMKITYQGMKDEIPTNRVICPCEIIFRDIWYVYAFCELRQERRLFNISRVQEIELLADHFHMEDDEAFAHDMSKAFGLFRGAKEYKVRIRFDYPAAQWVKEHIWIENQEIEELENKAILYSCNVEGLETIERWVLRYGDMARVIEPVELRNRIREILERMMAHY